MIRKMRVGDAHDVREIIVRALGYPCDENVVSQRIAELRDDDHCLSLVFEDEVGGCVLGFIHATRYETLHRGGGWDVISLAVAPKAQGRGVGTELLTAFEGRVVESGGSYVRLNSRVERTKAHAFYERMGYDCDKTQKRFVKQLDEAPVAMHCPPRA